MAAAAARNASAWLHRLHVPVQVRLTEEMRRSEQLEYTASRMYESGSLQGPVLLFRSLEQPTGPMLAADMGWTETIGRPIMAEQLPGDHHEIFDLPGARMIAARARETLGMAPLTGALEDSHSRRAKSLIGARDIPKVGA
jgi:thioesterase domain-containing protein